MATKTISVEALQSLLASIPHFASGPDGYVTVSVDEIDALKAFVESEYPDQAQELLEPIANLESLLDAATDGLDDDVELDLTDLLGFKREAGSIRRVTPPRLCGLADGGAEFVAGSLRVPVVQEGTTIKLGRLKAQGDSGFEKGMVTTQAGPIYFPSHRFTDGTDIYRISLYVRQDLGDLDAVALALFNGDDLAEILAPMGKGGGGSIRMKEFITSETVLPAEFNIVGVNRYATDSPYSKDGNSYSIVLEVDGGRTTVWAQGASEDFVRNNFAAVERKLASGKQLKLKVTGRKDVNGDNSKVSISHSVLDSSAESFFAAFTKNAIAPGPAAKEIAAAKEAAAAAPSPAPSGDVPTAVAVVEPVAEPAAAEPAAEPAAAPAAEAAAEPARATRKSAFSRAKAASAAAA
jgi:hypothetical protein